MRQILPTVLFIMRTRVLKLVNNLSVLLLYSLESSFIFDRVRYLFFRGISRTIECLNSFLSFYLTDIGRLDNFSLGVLKSIGVRGLHSFNYISSILSIRSNSTAGQV